MGYKTKAEINAAQRNMNINMEILLVGFANYMVDKNSGRNLFQRVFRNKKGKVTPKDLMDFFAIVNSPSEPKPQGQDTHSQAK